ncbi:MAG: hypothetical protein ACPHHR_08070 [Cycloclasticus sp.]|nr:hypothetical protein [Pseudomonadota bacterium]
MNDLTSLIEADVKSNNPSPLGNFDDSKLKGVARLAQDITNKEAEVAEAEKRLKNLKKDLRKMTEEDLPLMLTEMGVSSFKLADGSSVDIKPLYGASIPKDKVDQAHQWMRDNGFGDAIKNVVAVSFGMGEDEKAQEFLDRAKQMDLIPEQKESIHPSRLRAWVKEQVEAGNDFPMELFGAYVGQRAEIKGVK